MHELRRLVALLADGKFHSGEALGATLGLKRSTIWNRVQALGELGLDVFAVRGRGYRLARSLEPLDQDRIVAELDPRRAARLAGLEVLLEVDSTNRHLAEAARRGLPDPYACLAEGQTAGRGRLGRPWVSPFGRNVYLSVLRRFHQPPEAIQGLGLAVGAAAAEAVAGLGVADVGLKWPNDLMWRGRKLAGILLEMAGEGTGPWTLVAGIGMNVDMTPGVGAAIDQPWTDLATALGEPPSRNRCSFGTGLNVQPTYSNFTPVCSTNSLKARYSPPFQPG